MGFRPEDYYAGLWKHYLAVDLCWISDRAVPISNKKPEGAMQLDKSMDVYIAPSWSWAAQKQPIVTRLSVLDCKNETASITAWTAVKGLDPFGEVKNGLLMVQGKLLPLPSIIMQAPKVGDRSDSVFDRRCVYQENRRIAWVGLDRQLENIEEDGEKLFMMLLVSQLWGDKGMRRKRLGHGIILHPSKTKGKYIRVGGFETTSHGFTLFRNLKYRKIEVI